MTEVELQYIAPTRTPDDVEYWDTTKRCIRCTQFYTERQNNGCWYHTGKFKTPLHAAEGSLVGWSCCRSIPEESWLQKDGEAYFHNVNQEALRIDGKGCVFTEKHMEDRTFSASLAQFPVKSSTEESKTEVPEEEEDIEQQGPPLDVERDGYFLHPVSPTETLVGIALKYRSTTAELRKINRLTTDSQLFGKRTIYIPKKGEIQGPILAPPMSEEQKKRAAINNIKLKTGCSTEEAKWYLSDHDYDVDKAVAQWKEDSKWEKANSEKQQIKSKPYISKSGGTSPPKDTEEKGGLSFGLLSYFK